MTGDILAEDQQRADRPTAHAFGDLRNVRTHGPGGYAEELSAKAVGVLVRVDQQPVAFAGPGDGIGERAGASGQFREEEEFLVGLAGGGYDGDGAAGGAAQALGDLTQAGPTGPLAAHT